METLKSAFIVSALLVCYGDARRRSKEVYRINIDERGTRFNETVVINDKEKSVVYTVPEHNGVVGSKILFDYKTGYFATRIPKFKECYIQRIPKGHSSPGLVRKNLQQYRVFKESKSAVPVKTIAVAVMKGRRISPRELSSSLSAFCGDFVAYEGIQINHQELFPTKRNETNGKVWQKRNVYPINFPDVTIASIKITIKQDEKWKTITLSTCKRMPKYFPGLEEGGCDANPDSWEYECGAKTKSCMYTVKCKFDDGKIRCKETHFFTGWTCCNVKCGKR